MMDVRLLPAPLRGAVTPPPSKSLLHRQLICLAQAGEFPCPPDPSDDVEATVRGLWALYHEKAPVIDCGASGSTLRFLLPLAMARGQVGTVFTGTERLLERPLPGDWGLAATAGGLRVTRALSGGQIPVDGTRTSQLLSGLLMALPGLAADSELALTGPLASRPYVDLTLAVLRCCGVHIGQTDCGFTIPGGQRFRTVPLDAEPDWSAAAFWLAVRALGCAVAVTGLRRDSLQGDRAAAALCRCLPEEVDLTDIPDLLPPLALLAALRPGTETRFTGAARLRDKESDRLASVSAALTALGGRVRQEPEGLTVWGVERLSGGDLSYFAPISKTGAVWWAPYDGYLTEKLPALGRQMWYQSLQEHPKELCTREQFFRLLAAVLDGAWADLPVLNEVTATPDCDDQTILQFYRWGVLGGKDEYGTRSGDAWLTRGAAASMLTRLIDPQQRLTLTLRPLDLCRDVLGVEPDTVLLTVDGQPYTAEVLAPILASTAYEYDHSHFAAMTLEMNGGTPAGEAVQTFCQQLLCEKLAQELGLDIAPADALYLDGYHGLTAAGQAWQAYHDRLMLGVLQALNGPLPSERVPASEYEAVWNTLPLDDLGIRLRSLPYWSGH